MKKSSGRKKETKEQEINKALKKEQKISKEIKLPSSDIKNFSSLPDAEKIKLLFNTFPGETMGIVVGKQNPNDPYNAIVPKPTPHTNK